MNEKIYKDLTAIVFVLSIIFFSWKIYDIEQNNKKIRVVPENPFEQADVNISLINKIIDDTLEVSNDRDVEKILSNPLFKKIKNLNNQITILQEEVNKVGYDPFNLDGLIETEANRRAQMLSAVRVSGVISGKVPQAIINYGGRTHTVKENDKIMDLKVLSINVKDRSVKFLMAGGVVRNISLTTEEEFMVQHLKTIQKEKILY